MDRPVRTEDIVKLYFKLRVDILVCTGRQSAELSAEFRLLEAFRLVRYQLIQLEAASNPQGDSKLFFRHLQKLRHLAYRKLSPERSPNERTRCFTFR